MYSLVTSPHTTTPRSNSHVSRQLHFERNKKTPSNYYILEGGKKWHNYVLKIACFCNQRSDKPETYLRKKEWCFSWKRCCSAYHLIILLQYQSQTKCTRYVLLLQMILSISYIGWTYFLPFLTTQMPLCLSSLNYLSVSVSVTLSVSVSACQSTLQEKYHNSQVSSICFCVKKLFVTFLGSELTTLAPRGLTFYNCHHCPLLSTHFHLGSGGVGLLGAHSVPSHYCPSVKSPD